MPPGSRLAPFPSGHSLRGEPQARFDLTAGNYHLSDSVPSPLCDNEINRQDSSGLINFTQICLPFSLTRCLYLAVQLDSAEIALLPLFQSVPFYY